MALTHILLTTVGAQLVVVALFVRQPFVVLLTDMPSEPRNSLLVLTIVWLEFVYSLYA